MRGRKTLGLAIASVGLIVPSPAMASVEPSWVGSPMPTDTQTVTIQAPRHAWGIRAVAAYYNKHRGNWPVLHYGFGARCNDTTYCIKVTVTRNGRNDLLGTMLPGEPAHQGIRWINFNSSYRPYTLRARRYVACHELTHAMGLAHHPGAGCTGRNGRGGTAQVPSANELATINSLY